jgi:hypothetical protein
MQLVRVIRVLKNRVKKIQRVVVKKEQEKNLVWFLIYQDKENDKVLIEQQEKTVFEGSIYDSEAFLSNYKNGMFIYLDWGLSDLPEEEWDNLKEVGWTV